MSFPEFDSDDYISVRSSIFTSLKESALPDNIIKLPIHKNTAEDEILQIIPDIDLDDLTDAQELKLKNAVILRMAANFVYTNPQIISQTTLGIQKRMQPIEVKAKVANLLDRSNRILDQLAEDLGIEFIDTELPPITFTTIKGGRGKIKKGS